MEQTKLKILPAIDHDVREVLEVKVNPESLFPFNSNFYSIPPGYIGKYLTLKINYLEEEIEVFSGSLTIRKCKLETTFKNRKIWWIEDKILVQKMWEQQNFKTRKIKDNNQEQNIVSIKELFHEVQSRHPIVYENLTGG